MPAIPFDHLPDLSRVWVFASDRPVTGAAAERLLAEADRFLAHWQAHGSPLTCGRDWRDDRFLIIGVDQGPASASGCSIDGLFRVLRGLEPVIGATLVAGGRVFYRDADGHVQSVSRETFAERAVAGAISGRTRVFDPTVTSLADFRDHFETDAAQSWHAQLVPELGAAT